MTNEQRAVASARLYVAAAAIMETLYADITKADPSIDRTRLLARKRQQKHLWMRLARGDSPFAEMAATALREKHNFTPFDEKTALALDREIMRRLAAGVHDGVFFPAAAARENATELLTRIDALLDRCAGAPTSARVAA